MLNAFAAYSGVTLTVSYSTNVTPPPPVTYTVTLNPNGGTGSTASVSATYGNPMPAATAPTRSGYTFAGYYDTSATSGGTQYYTSTMSSARSWDKTSNTTLYARWTAVTNTYTVTLNPNGGTGGTASVSATYGNPMPAATAPTRSGYTFAGYYDTSATSGGTQYYTSAMSSAQSWDKTTAATLYARWTAVVTDPIVLTNDVPVTGLSDSKDSQKIYKITIPSGATNLQITTSGGTGDVDLYVKYGSVPTISIYDYRGYNSGNNESYSNPAPTAGDWYIMLNAFSAYSGVTLTISYSTNVTPPPPTTYTVTLNPNGGTGGTASVSATYGNPMPAATAPTRSGYTFAGYYDTSATSGGTQYYTSTMSSTQNWDKTTAATLYARWTTVVTDPIVLTSGVPVTGLSDNTGAQKIYKITIPSGATNLQITTSGGTGDVDLYAKLGSIPTTSIYDYCGYNGGNSESVTVPSPASGDWYIMLNAYVTYSGVTLTVSYSTIAPPPVTYTVTLNPNGGTGGTASVSATYGSPMPAATAPTRSGYTFAGYFDTSSPSGGAQYYSSTMASVRNWDKTSNTTLYARWMTGVTDLVVLANSIPITGLSDNTQNSQKIHKITIPVGATNLQITISGGTGDCDLYVKRGSFPTTSTYDACSRNGGNNDSVTVSAPEAGDWYIMLHAYSAYSGVTLTVSYYVLPLTVDKIILALAQPAYSTGTFNITSNIAWSTSVEPVGATWLTRNPATGSNNATVTVTAASANDTGSPRTASLLVTGSDITRTLIVTQAATTTTGLAPSALPIGATFTLTVTDTTAPGNPQTTRAYTVADDNMLSTTDDYGTLSLPYEYNATGATSTLIIPALDSLYSLKFTNATTGTLTLYTFDEDGDYEFPGTFAYAAPTYALTVTNGTGSGAYAANTTVTITADPAPSGKTFNYWTASNGGTFANANASTTTFTMPANATTVTANYKDNGGGGGGGGAPSFWLIGALAALLGLRRMTNKK